MIGLALAGFLAGIVNAFAGGGSMLTLPALVWYGLDPSAANATNRVGILLQCLASAWGFHQGGALDLRLALRLSLPACVGALVGAGFALGLSETALARAMTVVLLGSLGLSWVDARAWLEGGEPRDPRLVALMMLGVGLYGGFLQVGVGLPLLAVLVLGAGLDLVRANAAKVVIVAAFTVPALGVFAEAGTVDWVPGLALAAGTTVGGWTGSRLALQGGARVIRWVMTAAVLASAVRLFLHEV